MNTALHFASGNDEAVTPREFITWLINTRSGPLFADMAALASNRRVLTYYGPDHPDERFRDSLTVPWPLDGPLWLNPPYSDPERACKVPCRKRGCEKREFHLTADKPGCIDFVQKAYGEVMERGAEVWMLLAARTDNVWFHTFLWDETRQQPRVGVRLEFLRGRLRFEGEENSAPFPSLLVHLRRPGEPWRGR